MRTRLAIFASLVAALFLGSAVSALAWSNGPNHGNGFGTHDWVLTEGIRLAGKPAWLKTPTALAATDDPDTISRDFRYHEYDVWGSRHGDSPKRVASLYASAVSAYRAKNYAAASKYVGLLSHYYSDTCNPLHTDQIRAEDKIHLAYESAVQLRTDRSGENRAWIRSDGFQRVDNITTKTKSAAAFAHRHYAALITNYNRARFNAPVLSITKSTLNRAANDLADVVRTIPLDASAVSSSYSITTIAGANGSISPSSARVLSGASQTFQISPAMGYHVQEVLVDGVSVGAVRSYTFSNVRGPHTLRAIFAVDAFTGGTYTF